MTGNDFDKSRVSTALDVVKQHPGLAALIASPVILALVLLGVLVDPALAVATLLLIIGIGVYAIGRGGSGNYRS